MLKKIGQKLQIDLEYFVQNGIYLLLGDGVNMVLAFLASLAFANFLSPDTFGRYSFITAILAMLSVFSLPKMSVSVVKAIAQGREEIYLAAIKTVFKWSLIGSVILIGVGLYQWFSPKDILMVKAFLLTAALLPLAAVAVQHRAYLQGKEMFKTKTFVYILFSLVLNAGLIYAAWKNADLLILLSIFLGASVLVNGLWTWWTAIRAKHHRGDVKKDIQFGVHLSVIEVLPKIAHYGDKIIMGFYLDFTSVAIYAFAFLMPEQIKLIMKNIFELALPKYSKKSEKTLKRRIWWHAFYIMIPTLAIVILFVILAPWIFTFLFPKYLSSIPYAQVLALSLLFIPGKTFLTALEAKYKTGALLIYNTVLPIQKLMLMIILIPLLQIWGAVWALVLTRALELILTPLLFYIYFDQNDKPKKLFSF